MIKIENSITPMNSAQINPKRYAQPVYAVFTFRPR